MAPPSPEPLVPGAAVPDAGVASLYQEIILSHYRAPLHRGPLVGATVSVEQQNPLCGDTLTLQVRRDGDTIADAAFTARACSITQATASMLLRRVIGHSVQDARAVVADVEDLLEQSSPAGVRGAHLGDLRALGSVARFPARKACVRLVTSALLEALATPR